MARARGFSGLVGNDAFGGYVLQALASAGVDTSQIGRAQARTAATSVLVRADGARALLHRPGASREAFPRPIDFTPEIVAACGHFHLANPFGLPLLRAHAGETLRRARAAALTTSLDSGWDSLGEWLDVIGPCFPHLDYFFLNEDELRMMGTIPSFLERGVGAVILKRGAEGCEVHAGNEAFHVPGCRVNVFDTTGAGDCFAGVFLAELQTGASLRQAARFANAAAALNVQSLGATTGLRPRAEVEAWMNSQPVTSVPSL